MVLAEALAEHLIEKFAARKATELSELKAERPIVKFMIDRLVGALNRPRPAGSQP